MWDWELAWALAIEALAYTAVTGGLFFLYRRSKMREMWKNLLTGLIYGACVIVSGHLGTDNIFMIVSVRNIGPLAAGLFFSPISGILAGVTGAAERYISGSVFEFDSFTYIAGTIGIAAAGLLGAILNRWIHKGRRPSIFHAFLTGTLVETFHIYAVLMADRLSMSFAQTLMQMIAAPTVVMTGAGIALCSGTVMWIGGNKPQLGLKRSGGEARSTVPIATRFQRWLMAVTFCLFLINFGITWNIQTRTAWEEAVNAMETTWYRAKLAYEETGDIHALEEHLIDKQDPQNWYIVMDDEGYASFVVGLYNVGLDPEDEAQIRAHERDGLFTVSLASLAEAEMTCFTEQTEGFHLYVVRITHDIYQTRNVVMFENTLSDILMFAGLYILIVILAEQLVVRNLKNVNKSLEIITGGQLDETVDVHESSEFSELSIDINKTVTALRGYIDAAEKRMEEELRLAAAIQDSALPKNFRMPSGKIELYAMMTPARQVGGDFYDFFLSGTETLCLVIADVSGKGIPAAMFMMRAKTAIRDYARSADGPEGLLENVNNALCEDNDADMFVTVWLGLLNMKTGVMRCANAGHEYPALMRAGGGYELLKHKHGMMLATFRNIRMKEYEIQMNPGDRLFVYTDGVAEAVNGQNEAYGTDRMTETLNRLKDQTQEQTLQGMLEDIRQFAGGTEQFDDITMLGLTYWNHGENMVRY